jgi:hypothetical protein
MNLKNPMLSVSVKYGLFASLFCIILFSSLYFFGKNPLLIPLFLDFRILIFAIFLLFGIRDFKDNKNNGILHFWQGFATGAIIVLMVSVVMGLFIFLLGGIIDRNFTGNYISQMLQNLTGAKEKIISEYGLDVYTKAVNLVPTTTLADLALDYFIKTIPLGLIITILISLAFRKKE